MEKIPLERIANQKFNVQLAGKNYNITINTRSGLSYLSINVRDTPLVAGRICLPNKRIEIPPYLFPGVLFFHCQDNETPLYTKFGILHNLYYATRYEFRLISDGAYGS